ncbi:CdaR family transcriptional regulator [Nocardia sp. CC227C]|uniref:PucR family transcriptional regulator n=1 Tax=Nocardia sp. CC227C TaxID=3044562 RepID=UPI00278BC969|nr:helix-turn-helix domain-containing protein [Nocardia sp. CC227C]
MDTPRYPPDGFVARACAALLDRIDEVVAVVAAEIERAEPVYGTQRLVGGDDLRRNNRENLGAILRYLAGYPGGLGTAMPRETGYRRAQDGVPLPAVLRAYRIGTGVVWNQLLTMTDHDPTAERELLDAASEVWKLVDEYSQAMTTGYQEAVAERLRSDARAHDAALDALLTGHADGARMWECARTLGLPASGQFVVVVAATDAVNVTPGVGKSLAMLGVASAWRVRVDSHAGIIALTPRFTDQRLCSALTERAVGRVGISSPYTGLTETPAALRQAELACAATEPGSHEVIRYRDALIPMLLAGSPEVASALADSVLAPILALPAHDRDTLLDTARMWFAHDGEVSTVASALYCHRNTVRFRVNRIADLTGRRLSSPRAATEIQLALEACRILDRPSRTPRIAPDPGRREPDAGASVVDGGHVVGVLAQHDRALQ